MNFLSLIRVTVTINGYSEKQVETTGETNNLKIGYAYSIVEAPNYYYQIIAWDLNSKYDENKSIFRDVIGSIKQINGSNELPPSKLESDIKK